jgi:hypothetical protein
MEKLLTFDKPKKVLTTEKHNKKFQSDSGIAGTYVPNMSKEDMNKWKAKHIKGEDERIEIRKTIECAQLLIVVYKNAYQPSYPEFPEYDGGGKDAYWEQANEIYRHDRNCWEKRHQNVRISMNGKLDLTWDNFWDLQEVVKEAFEILL